ncbi:kinase-like protein [Wallemia mellicola]|uniref:Translation initiation factor eIF2B subunit delta n=1 Tax=Wallemia mellicola TaxID=1708541 RepID=A0A4T0NKL4_9BASI|nr:kinase-like protein [Wallemia mellicola]
MEGLEEIQSNELEALSAIYGDLFQLKKQLKTAWQGAASLPEYMIKLEPLEDDLKAYVSIELHVKIPKTYPNVPPQLSIRNTRGLSVSQRDDLTKQVIKKSRDSDLIGQPMLYDLAIFCQEYISTNHTIIGNASLATRMQERLNAVQAEKIQREESYEAKKRHKQSLEADALAQRIEADIKRKEEQIKSEADKQNTQLSRQRQYKSHDVWTETFDNNTTVHVGNHISSDGLSSIYLCSVANSDELLELEVFLINSDYYDKSAGKRKLQDVARILDKLSKLKSDHIEHIHASKLRPHPQASGTIVWELLILHSRTSGMSTLSDLLQACDNFRVDLATSYLTQILVGLQELHKLDVVHMDISPSNILILPGKTLTIIRPSYAKTILNLHRSNPINERKISEIFVNEGWQAPECLETQQFSRKRDIWDTGVCFINMLFGLDAMSYPSPKVLLDKSGDVPQHTLDIISYMLESNPSQRGSAVQLLDKLYNSSDNSSSVATTRPKSSALYHNSSTPKPPATPSMSVKAAPPIDPFWQSTNQQSNTSRFRSDFEEVEHLGKGGFGEVVKARNRLDGLFYAIKKVRLKSNTDSKLFREVLSLSRLNSRYVVRYFGCWIEEAAQTVSQSFAEKDVNTKKAGTSDSYSFSMHKLLNPKFDDSLSVAKTASRDDGIFFEADSDEDTENGEEDEEEEEEEEEEIESESGTSSSDSDSELSTNQDTRHNRNFNHSRILYIQMQYCEKLTLSEALEEGLSVDERWKIFRQILDGLAYINTLGIVHRDLKPSNVFIDAQGDVKIGDFGLATLGVNDPNYSTVFDKALVNQSNDTTSAVGTSLYIAPEIANSSGRYTEKVDMFSLGVGMERVQVLHQMRQPKPRFPATFPDNLTTERKLIEWMLKHDQSERPSAAEVLHSSLLPETMEEEYFEEALRVLHPDQPRYQKLVSRLFNNSPNALQYHTYDTGGGPLSPDAIIRLVQEHLGWVFRLHGAVPLEPPLLSPKPDNSDKTKEKDVVSLLDSTGCVVHLPHNGLLGFARMILKQNIVRTKRFWMGGRFKRNVAGGQPIKESEANFDIVSPTTTKAMEGEIMSVVNKTLELPFLKTSNWEVRINHSIIIEIILSLFPHKKRSVVLGIFDQLGKGVSMPHIRSQLASQVDNSRSVTRLEELDHLLLKGNDYKTILNDMMKVLPHYKEQLKETLEELNNTFEYFARNHNRRNIIFDTTTMLNNSYEDYASGLVLDISRRVAKGRREVMAIGGRSDNLLERLSHTTRSLPYMVGLRINADVVANCLMESSNKKTTSKAISSYKSYMPRRCDVYVGSFGNAYNGMMSERMDVASTLWDAGISADVMYDGAHAYQSPDMLMERCRGEGITYLVLLKANSTVMKVRNTLSKKSEEEVDRHDLVDYLSRKLSELRQTQEETARVHEKDAPGVDIHLAMPSEIAWSFKKDDNKNRINKRNRALMSDRAENALQEYENFKKKMSEAKQKKINQKSERRKQKVEARGGGERPEHTQQASQHHGSVKSDGGSVVNSTAPVATTASPFKHLHKSPNTIVKPENVHPQISRLGSLLSNFSIVGANARTLALMSGLKLVIGSYNTPAGTTLSRNLLSVISPQISHLESCRPKSLSNGSAIRWLKLQIANIDPDMDDNDARNHLCMLIDCYVRDRITLADDEIVKNTLSKLSSTVQTTILVYARSSIVEKTLIEAKKAGKMLSVIIVDSKPLNEGKNLLTRLTDMGVECTYAHLSALPSLLPNINMTLLGAHAILANGALYSRVGNASVALLSKLHNVPVYALAESYKFVDRMMLDSITTNEISPPDLFELDVNGLGQNVRQESLLYDVTPPKLLEAIISEVGIHPPSSVSGLMFRARA